MPDVKSIYRAHKMACGRLVGLENGKRAFVGCFLRSAAGGVVYIYTRTRTRKGFGLGRAFCLENKTTSARILENKTRAFHRCLENKTRVGMKKRSTGFFSVVILKAANGRWLRTRARALAPFFLFRLSYKKKLFFSFFSFFYIFSFFLFVFFCKS